jgi:hypothetical protein
VAKEINEKTFELNITYELLNLSKSAVIRLFPLEKTNIALWGFWDVINNSVLYAQGLTQKQEEKSGYDVSLNVNLPGLLPRRIVFFQFKSGLEKEFTLNTESKFKGNIINRKPHIEFKINDAASKSQHINLRQFSNEDSINPDSVMYVFPRITKYQDFFKNIGNLIWTCSFIPVNEIDKQASKPIEKGNVHYFRTTYDGNDSEVNSDPFPFEYDKTIVSRLLAEFICIQLERMFKYSFNLNLKYNILYDDLKTELENFLSFQFSDDQQRSIINEIVVNYLENVQKIYNEVSRVPSAPSIYTTIIPTSGIKMKFKEFIDFSSVSYLAF